VGPHGYSPKITSSTSEEIHRSRRNSITLGRTRPGPNQSRGSFLPPSSRGSQSVDKTKQLEEETTRVHQGGQQPKDYPCTPQRAASDRRWAGTTKGRNTKWQASTRRTRQKERERERSATHRGRCCKKTERKTTTQARADARMSTCLLARSWSEILLRNAKQSKGSRGSGKGLPSPTCRVRIILLCGGRFPWAPGPGPLNRSVSISAFGGKYRQTCGAVLFWGTAAARPPSVIP
jgi:hypothetical protein